MDFSDRFVAKKTLGQRASVSPQVRKMRQVHPSGFEPETLGSEDRIRDEPKAFPPNDLRTIANSETASSA